MCVLVAVRLRTRFGGCCCQVLVCEGVSRNEDVLLTLASHQMSDVGSEHPIGYSICWPQPLAVQAH
jgi:hypothetical protein